MTRTALPPSLVGVLLVGIVPAGCGSSIHGCHPKRFEAMASIPTTPQLEHVELPESSTAYAQHVGSASPDTWVVITRLDASVGGSTTFGQIRIVNSHLDQDALRRLLTKGVRDTPEAFEFTKAHSPPARIGKHLDIFADRQSPFGALVDVLDASRSAGFENVHLIQRASAHELELRGSIVESVPADIPDDPDTVVDPGLCLAVFLLKNKLVLAGTGGRIEIANQTDGGYDFNALNEKLRQIKDDFPNEYKICISGPETTALGLIVRAMDTCRQSPQFGEERAPGNRFLFWEQMLGLPAMCVSRGSIPPEPDAN